ncbi:MAG: biotin--[acetyl-CoA-carboxylase] ligase [Maribacter sp.]|nr:biotin--[acetyl-CoA-carboxylase] ligase [Maribacter sp.]
MQRIKLSATDSTNAYLKNLMVSMPLEDYTVVVAQEQFKGRGQMNAHWQSERGKNLTFSVLKKIQKVSIQEQFTINICTSLAIFESLKSLHVPDISIKWPNDILSGTTKICGILIENVLSGNRIQASVIGIGLNVNQLHFKNLRNVSSLQLLLGKTFDLDELLEDIVKKLKNKFLYLTGASIEDVWQDYEKVLFRKDKPSTFKNANGELFMGFIRGVSYDGKLQVELEDHILAGFDLKEIKLLY